MGNHFSLYSEPMDIEELTPTYSYPYNEFQNTKHLRNIYYEINEINKTLRIDPTQKNIEQNPNPIDLIIFSKKIEGFDISLPYLKFDSLSLIQEYKAIYPFILNTHDINIEDNSYIHLASQSINQDFWSCVGFFHIIVYLKLPKNIQIKSIKKGLILGEWKNYPIEFELKTENEEIMNI